MIKNSAVKQLDYDAILNEFKGNKTQLQVLLNAVENNEIMEWNYWKHKNKIEDIDLRGLYLPNTILIGIDLSGADLSFSNLNNSNLSSSELSGTVFIDANLENSKFIHSQMYGTALTRSNLRGANFDGASLNSAYLKEADITGAIFQGTTYYNWTITDIKCNYIMRGINELIKEPHSKDYEVGEFEQLYKDTNKLEYIFVDEFTVIDILLMEKVVNEINDQNKDFDLKLDCFHQRGQARAEFVITDLSKSKDTIEEINNKFKSLKLEYKHKLELANMKSDTLQDVLKSFINSPQTVTNTITHNYQIENSSLVLLTNNLDNDPLFRNNLKKELLDIRNEISRVYELSEYNDSIVCLTEAEKAIDVEDSSKVIENLKKAGKVVLDTSISIGSSIATDFLKKIIGL